MEDFIKKYWESNAQAYGGDFWASWGDEYAIRLEIETISEYIFDGAAVLDVGCANGYSAIRQCERHKLKSITGVDFSETMIHNANLNRQRTSDSELLSFKVGDIRALPLPDACYDVVYTTRVLINLPSWEQQQQGILECLRVMKPEGVLILSEAFWEPLTRLNALRAIGGLAPLREHDFNRYLKKQDLEAYIKEQGYCFSCVDFSSVYYIGSRFLRELATDYQQYEGYTNPINKDFFDLETKYSGGNFGIQQAYVIRKQR